MLGQGALGLMPPTAAETRQTAFKVFLNASLDGAPGDIGVRGNRVVAQAVALEPEDLHLALDSGVGVMVPVVGQSPPVLRREGDRPHHRSTGCRPQVGPSLQVKPVDTRLQLVPGPDAPGIIVIR